VEVELMFGDSNDDDEDDRDHDLTTEWNV